jgi:hypothetical protein
MRLFQNPLDFEEGIYTYILYHTLVRKSCFFEKKLKKIQKNDTVLRFIGEDLLGSGNSLGN